MQEILVNPRNKKRGPYKATTKITCATCGKTEEVSPCYRKKKYCSKICMLANKEMWKTQISKRKVTLKKRYGTTDVYKITEQIHGKKYVENMIKKQNIEKKTRYVRRGEKRNKELNNRISNTLKGHPVSKETRAKISKSMVKNKTPEYRKKMSKIVKKLWQNPDYVGKERKTNGYICGHFKSYKNNCDLWFQSSYELAAYIKLEHDENIKAYGRCCFSIPYLFEGEAHNYVPDIMIEYKNKTKAIIEIKPLGLCKDVINIIKFDSGRDYCREHNMKYIIWTEKDIFDV